jgi:hypothetical protein
MVHAYLMYGYPTQTIQETIDSLEMVRQMFELGIIQSGFWHQFAMTAHSPVGLNPDEFGVIPLQNEISFANNDINFIDKTGIDHEQFSYGLKKSLYNFMHGMCFDYTLQDWFDFKIPNTKIVSDYIYTCLEKDEDFSFKPFAKVFWLGSKPEVSSFSKSKKGMSWQMMELTFQSKTDTFKINLEEGKANWLLLLLKKISVYEGAVYSLLQIKSEYEIEFEDFELFWFSKPIIQLRNNGLLVL